MTEQELKPIEEIMEKTGEEEQAELEQLKVEHSRLRQEYFSLLYTNEASADAIHGTNKGKPKVAKMVKLEVLQLEDLLSGIDNLAKYIGRQGVPWVPLIIGAIVIAVIAMFTLNPGMMDKATLFLNNTQNQIVIVVILLIVFGMLWLLTNRRKARMMT